MNCMWLDDYVAENHDGNWSEWARAVGVARPTAAHVYAGKRCIVLDDDLAVRLVPGSFDAEPRELDRTNTGISIVSTSG